MGKDLLVPNLVAHYRRLLLPGVFGSGADPARPIGAVTFQAEEIPERCELVRTENAKIVAEYLGGHTHAMEIVDRIIKEAQDGLGLLANGDEEALADSPEAISGLEAIARIDGSRPSFLVVNDQVVLDSGLAGAWSSQLSANASNLKMILPRIGRIDVPGSTIGFVGTGFLIGEDVIVTNRHVLERAGVCDSNGLWRLFDGAAIDFGGEFGGRKSANRRRLKDVLFHSERSIEFPATNSPALDLALIRLEPGDGAPPPGLDLSIDLPVENGRVGMEVYTIGYPGNPVPYDYAPTLLDQLFEPQFGFKRLAPGAILTTPSGANGRTLAHDATLFAGNSGSLLVAAGSEWIALGIHFGGALRGRVENWAHQLSLVLDERDAHSGRPLRDVLQSLDIVPAAPASDSGPSSPQDINRIRQEYIKVTEHLEHAPRWQRELGKTGTETLSHVAAVGTEVAESSGETTASPDTSSVPETGVVLRQAEDAAALSGRFHPDQLLAWKNEPTKQAVLSQLAASCQIETFSEQLSWMLLPERRKDVLRRFQDKHALKARLTGPLPPTDQFGRLLREVLEQGTVSNLARRSVEELVQLSAVVEAIDGLGLLDLPPGEIQRQLAQDNFLEEYGVLLEKGFVGRTAELKQLRSFLTKPLEPGRYYGSLLLTGIGGAGKSTLLGQFAHEVYKKRLATIVILDLDRPGIDPTDTDWLSHEIARQVGRQYPKTMELLKGSRRKAQKHQAGTLETEVATDLESISQKRTTHNVVLGSEEGVSRALTEAGAMDRPLLLVFDTFEMATRNTEGISLLQWWLNDVADLVAPASLRVIFSGRSLDADLFKPKPLELKIDELPPGPAQKLLEQYVSPALAQRILNSNILPRRPLELKLLANAVTDKGESSITSLENELAGLDNDDPFSDDQTNIRDQLKAGLIYRRVLNRINDPIAEKLAFPGLVLRYVSEDVVRNVLSPALGLGLTAQEANQALKTLAAHTWLVQEKVIGQYWHRSDLRRLMMRLLSGQEEEQAKKISLKAQEFFTERGAAGDEVEAMYHRLWLIRTPADGESVNLEELASVALSLLAYEEDLSATARSLIRLALNQPIPGDQVIALPKPFLSKAYRQIGTDLTDADEFQKALKLYRRGQQDQLPIHWEEERRIWEIETLFQTAHWAELRALTPPGTSNAGVHGLINRLFPAELIGANDLSAEAVEQRLLPLSSRALRGAKDNGTLACRLMMALMLLHQRDPLSGESWKKARELAEGVAQGKQKSFSAFLDSRIQLLQLSSGSTMPVEVRFAPSTLLLDPKWLHTAANRVRRSSTDLTDLLAEVREAVQRVLDGPQRTARRVLSAADGLYKHRDLWREATLTLRVSDGRVPWLLRGPDLEFRTPLRFVLMDLYPMREDRMRLAELIASVLPYPLDDLKPETFADLIGVDPEHGLKPFIELVDRNWALGQLLTQAAGDHPQATALADVKAAYERWDSVVNQSLGKE